MVILKIKKSDLILTRFFRIVITKILFRVSEHNKGNYNDDSLIICPNHVSNWDVPIIWALFASDRPVRLMMMAEFWESFPFLGPILERAGFHPISRRKKNPQEIENLVTYLKDTKDKLLILFPEGRHIDPEVAAKLGQAYCKMVKKGAFYIAAKSGKKVLPVFIEPNQYFRRVRVHYGNPIDPGDLSIYDENGGVSRKKLDDFIWEWQKNISSIYFNLHLLEDRKVREYKIHKVYRESNGYDVSVDPNIAYRAML
ncbi:MAG: lysophospholipid acyltransferase family protein [Clostridiaceae bacterium]